MASSKLKRKSSSSSSTKLSSISDLQIHHQNTTTTNLSLSMTTVDDGIFHNNSATLIGADISLLDAAGAVTAISDTEAASGGGAIRRPKTVDDVWREIVAGRRECKQEEVDVNDMMTLEDFLAKADAVENDDDVKVEPPAERLSSGGVFGYDQGVIMSQRSGVEEIGGGRGKRKVLLEPLDKAAERRQRRMIKNRESAARSRERKQAYQVELESMAVKLEEENESLLKEKAERTKDRLKQLMEKVVPFVEKRRPERVLRRVRSTHW